jgi:hypothetical protein
MISAPARAARSFGRIEYVIPRVAGHISAPPIPISARQAISTQASGASPPSSEKKAKTTAPRKKIRRRPSKSARRPPVTIRTPKMSA